MNPLISIIICTYNRSRLLKRAIRSVIRQTYQHWELIIIDDGSFDKTEQIVLPFAKSDTRITYLRQSNKGLVSSRNRGLNLAEGKYVTFLDSDDEYKPTHISSRVKFMENHTNIALVHGGIEFVGPPPKRYVMDATRPGKKIHLSNCFISPTFFARRKALTRLEGFRELPYAEDLDLVRRLQKRKLKVIKANRRTYLYHVDSDNRLCDLYEEGGEKAILNFRRMDGSGQTNSFSPSSAARTA